MASILLIPSTDAAFLHTPRTVALLQNLGHTVSIALEEDSPFASYVTAATGHAPACISNGIRGYKAVLMAPYAIGTPLPDTKLPIVLAPLMGEHEANPPQQPGCITLMPPDEAISFGMLGRGRIATPEQCVEAVITALTKQDLAGMKILITAGPTIEDADPARFISNRSTGKMGTAIARMAARRGACVHLIHGPMQAAVPMVANVKPIPVRSAEEMHKAVMDDITNIDVAILCAAVADFAPINYSEEKIKKGKSKLFTLQMKRTPDILASVGALKNRPFLVGFAAESNDIRANAMDKLVRKNCDMLCANDITAPGCGFATATNRLLVFMRDGNTKVIPLATKERVADRLLNMIAAKYNPTHSSRHE